MLPHLYASLDGADPVLLWSAKKAKDHLDGKVLAAVIKEFSARWSVWMEMPMRAPIGRTDPVRRVRWPRERACLTPEERHSAFVAGPITLTAPEKPEAACPPNSPPPSAP